MKIPAGASNPLKLIPGVGCRVLSVDSSPQSSVYSPLSCKLFMFTLESLWKKVDNCAICKKSENTLQHILGGGKEQQPKTMFVFINPTHRNITSKPYYRGPRYPFAGTKEIWKVFVEAGILTMDVLKITEDAWDNKTITDLLKIIEGSGSYLTNLVKCTGSDGNPPAKGQIEYSKDLLFEEINIVKPDRIVAFGLLPFKALTNQNIKLSEYFSGEIKPMDSIQINKKVYPVWPCYFPVGRGNPKKAAEALLRIKPLFQ